MDETTPPPKRLSPRLITAALVALAAAALIGYARYGANQRMSAQQVYDTLDVYGAQLQNFEKTAVSHEDRIKALEEAVRKLASASPAEATPASPPPAAAAPLSAADSERIAGLEKEIAALKAAMPLQNDAAIGQSIRLLSAFHRFSGKVLSGQPFAAELSKLEDLADADESSGSPLATLAPFADNGIPTFATLLATFDLAVDSLNTAEAVPPADAGFWERLGYNLTHLVSIRRIDDAETGHSESAIVGRAQAHLERQEIEAAIAEIKSLPESARGNFSAWLDDAQMATEAPTLIDQLEEDVMQKAFHTQSPAAAPPVGKPLEPTPSAPKP